MKSSFQTILLVMFAVAFAAAVLVFSGLISFGSKNKDDTTPQGNVVVWGIFPQNLIQPYLDNFNIANNAYSISYQERNPETFSQDLIVALANDRSPDMVLFSSEYLATLKDKLYTIPYTTYSERLYRDTNIDGAQIFLTPDGISAFPLVVDPLVVYYNKDILSQANFVLPPKTWANLQQISSRFIKLDSANRITQTSIALGTAGNINNISDIISTLFMQTGSSISVFNPQTGLYSSNLDRNIANAQTLPTASALDFYTSFSNTTNSNYSWNSGLPNSLDMFLSGRSAFYIGSASELFSIQSQNPNLNFDVMQMFQTGGSVRPVTYGSFIGVGIMKKAPNLTAAYAAANFMATAPSIDNFSKSFSLPPVRRDLILVQQQNPYVAVFFNAALTAFGWSTPDPTSTDKIFRDMINNVTSGRTDSTTAIYDVARDLESAY